MEKIVLISCVSKKKDEKSKVKDIYISPLFRYNLSYAFSMHPDKIFVLSAKHGLLNLDDYIAPYDITLNKMKTSEIIAWSKHVLTQLEQVSDLNNDKFIFLAGEKYRKHLITAITNYEIPLAGKTIGNQLKFLKENTKKQ